ncbi:BSD domain-containing protein 1-A [Cajanus cajan]|uniref:BSD domain-containing protein 1-A n=1 Tax=Cajanus cajan TaxID=3821 RepID=UPI00098D8F48|nr:BSD domain-containing protein 1-A [Cajanus cajan]
MNFFASVFSDDPGPSDNDPSGAAQIRIHSLWKTLSAKSESIIETYRRDLQEFGTGLKKEIEVAHGSLETVGNAIDHFGNTVVKGTAQIMSHGKDAILHSDDDKKINNSTGKGFNSKRYSRFDAQVRAIQGDVSTYSEVPQDLDEFNNWKSGFSLEGKWDEMEGFLRENEAMESVYKRFVPSVVDRDMFWFRYYYRVYKFKKAEDVRARLVRKMSREEENLSWDLDDDDDDDDDGDVGGDGTKRSNVEEVQSKGLGNKKDECVEESKVDKSEEAVENKGDGSKKSSIHEVDNTGNRNDSISGVDSDEKLVMKRKVDDGKAPPVASQHLGNENEKEEEEDFEWDEIENFSRIDGEGKGARTGSPSKVDLRKRLSVPQEQEDEDLSWDIEDNDEPAKA